MRAPIYPSLDDIYCTTILFPLQQKKVLASYFSHSFWLVPTSYYFLPHALSWYHLHFVISSIHSPPLRSRSRSPQPQQPPSLPHDFENLKSRFQVHEFWFDVFVNCLVDWKMRRKGCNCMDANLQREIKNFNEKKKNLQTDDYISWQKHTGNL